MTRHKTSKPSKPKLRKRGQKIGQKTLRRAGDLAADIFGFLQSR